MRVQAELHFPNRPALAVRTIDISAEGLSVQCPVNLPVHTTCSVRLHLPVAPTGRLPLVFNAVICYSILSSQGFQLGMNTHGIDEPGRAAIARYLRT